MPGVGFARIRTGGKGKTAIGEALTLKRQIAGYHVGTSGWHYPHWRGPFYPETLPASRWLAYYVERFSCVEINNSFYRLPELATVEQWHRQSPEDFLFAVKAWRVITHRKKLKECASALEAFFDRIQPFKEKLGPILFQLPPRWKVNPGRLREFLKRLPSGHRCAFEFRDTTWHTPEVYAALVEFNAAFCIFQLAGFIAPAQATADFVYVRLHGPGGAYAGNYDPRTLQLWARRLRRWHEEGKDCFVFFDNDEAAYAAHNAFYLQHLLRPRRRRS